MPAVLLGCSSAGPRRVVIGDGPLCEGCERARSGGHLFAHAMSDEACQLVASSAAHVRHAETSRASGGRVYRFAGGATYGKAAEDGGKYEVLVEGAGADRGCRFTVEAWRWGQGERSSDAVTKADVDRVLGLLEVSADVWSRCARACAGAYEGEVFRRPCAEQCFACRDTGVSPRAPAAQCAAWRE